MAHTVLHDDRSKAKFGQNRHSIRCDDLTNSVKSFIERLTDVLCSNRTSSSSVAQLRSHLESSPPLLLLLDGADFILDPQAPEFEDIYATIEVFGSYEHVCMVTTSRMHPDIRGFHRIEIPTLSEDDARDIFYSLSDLHSSSVVDAFITRLDFHPLSLEHFASYVRENRSSGMSWSLHFALRRLASLGQSPGLCFQQPQPSHLGSKNANWRGFSTKPPE